MLSVKVDRALLIAAALVAMPLFAVLAAETPDGGSAELRQQMESVRQEVRERRQVLQTEAKERRKVFREKTKERVEALRINFGEIRAKRIEEFFSNMVGKFENAIDRLDALEARIEKYLDKLSEQGKDVSGLYLKLEAAKNKITEAENSLDEAKVKFNSMSSSADPRIAFNDVKTLVRSVAEKVKEAHAVLADVVRSIKGASEKATTTPER